MSIYGQYIYKFIFFDITLIVSYCFTGTCISLLAISVEQKAHKLYVVEQFFIHRLDFYGDHEKNLLSSYVHSLTSDSNV